MAYHPDMEVSDFQRVCESILQDIWYLAHLLKINFYLWKVKHKLSIQISIIYFKEIDQPGALKKKKLYTHASANCFMKKTSHLINKYFSESRSIVCSLDYKKKKMLMLMPGISK